MSTHLDQTKRRLRLPLGEFCRITAGGTPKRNVARYWDGGLIPWVTTAEVRYWTIDSTREHITAEGLKNSSAKIFPAGTLLIAMYGQGKTRGQVARLGIAAATNQACAAIIPDERASPEYLYQYLAHSYHQIRALSNTGGQENLSSEIIANFVINLPPVHEQRRIADILATWDGALEGLRRQNAAKEKTLKYLRESLIHGTYRLQQRNEPWPTIKLGDVSKHLTQRHGSRFGRDSIMGVTKTEGLVPMKEHVIADDIARYLILPPHAFAYNPMRLNIGSIVMSELNHDVIVSPDYVVFTCKSDRLDPHFLNHLRRTKLWSDFMTIAGNGSVRVRIYYASLAELEFRLPPASEQQAIIEVLDDAERELRALEAERRALEKQRDALASELLTGRLRVRDADGARAAVAD